MDKQEILLIKTALNSQGYTVYIDWVNDREMLNRKNQDNNTWNALYMRMDQSCRLLYVMTDNCIDSCSTKREIMYFKKKEKPIYVYQPKAVTREIPQYLDGCKEIECINAVSFN